MKISGARVFPIQKSSWLEMSMIDTLADNLAKAQNSSDVEQPRLEKQVVRLCDASSAFKCR